MTGSLYSLLRGACLCAAAILSCTLVVPPAAASTVKLDIHALAQVLEPLAPGEVTAALDQGGKFLRREEYVRRLYERRAGRAIWNDAASIVTLRAAVSTSVNDGLRKGELDYPKIGNPFDPEAALDAAEREILLTDTLVALGDRLTNGRADPRGLAPAAGIPLAWRDVEPLVLENLSRQLDEGDLVGVIESMRPTSGFYTRLRSALTKELNGGKDAALIATLRVNLERARWFARLIADEDRVVVNIPAFTAALYLDGVRVWQERTIVGKQDRRTPVFVSAMKDVVLDPTWTVPRSIIEDRLFDEASGDPAGFAAQGFQLRDNRGVWHYPTDIEWSRYTADSLPFDMVQMPGSSNALGQVKFLFDNPYAVYLHDTPSRHLFEQDNRALSHGCVRVQHPDELARLILSNRGGLDQQAIASLHDDGDNVPVTLYEPLMVALLYWTVDVDENGNIVHYDDIYDRDEVILKALNDGAVLQAL